MTASSDCLRAPCRATAIRPSGGSMVVGRPSGKPRLAVYVNPLSGTGTDFVLDSVAAWVLVVDPAGPSAIDARLVAAALDLTPAQSQVAAMLAEGHGVSDIAAATGRRPSTVSRAVKNRSTGGAACPAARRSYGWCCRCRTSRIRVTDRGLQLCRSIMAILRPRRPALSCLSAVTITEGCRPLSCGRPFTARSPGPVLPRGWRSARCRSPAGRRPAEPATGAAPVTRCGGTPGAAA